MITNENKDIKILDFGVSSAVSKLTTINHPNAKLTGTEMYMPLEILTKQKKASTKTDVWSLGATIFNLLMDGMEWITLDPFIEKAPTQEIYQIKYGIKLDDI